MDLHLPAPRRPVRITFCGRPAVTTGFVNLGLIFNSSLYRLAERAPGAAAQVGSQDGEAQRYRCPAMVLFSRPCHASLSGSNEAVGGAEGRQTATHRGRRGQVADEWYVECDHEGLPPGCYRVAEGHEYVVVKDTSRHIHRFEAEKTLDTPESSEVRQPSRRQESESSTAKPCSSRGASRPTSLTAKALTTQGRDEGAAGVQRESGSTLESVRGHLSEEKAPKRMKRGALSALNHEGNMVDSRPKRGRSAGNVVEATAASVTPDSAPISPVATTVRAVEGDLEQRQSPAKPAVESRAAPAASTPGHGGGKSPDDAWTVAQQLNLEVILAPSEPAAFALTRSFSSASAVPGMDETRSASVQAAMRTSVDIARAFTEARIVAKHSSHVSPRSGDRRRGPSPVVLGLPAHPRVATDPVTVAACQAKGSVEPLALIAKSMPPCRVPGEDSSVAPRGGHNAARGASETASSAVHPAAADGRSHRRSNWRRRPGEDSASRSQSPEDRGGVEAASKSVADRTPRQRMQPSPSRATDHQPFLTPKAECVTPLPRKRPQQRRVIPYLRSSSSSSSSTSSLPPGVASNARGRSAGTSATTEVVVSPSPQVWRKSNVAAERRDGSGVARRSYSPDLSSVPKTTPRHPHGEALDEPDDRDVLPSTDQPEHPQLTRRRIPFGAPDTPQQQAMPADPARKAGAPHRCVDEGKGDGAEALAAPGSTRRKKGALAPEALLTQPPSPPTLKGGTRTALVEANGALSQRSPRGLQPAQSPLSPPHPMDLGQAGPLAAEHVAAARSPSGADVAHAGIETGSWPVEKTRIGSGGETVSGGRRTNPSAQRARDPDGHSDHPLRDSAMRSSDGGSAGGGPRGGEGFGGSRFAGSAAHLRDSSYSPGSAPRWTPPMIPLQSPALGFTKIDNTLSLDFSLDTSSMSSDGSSVYGEDFL